MWGGTQQKSYPQHVSNHPIRVFLSKYVLNRVVAARNSGQ